MKLVCYNEKGGSAKTSAVLALCVPLGLPLLDLDPQATASRWLDRRDPPFPRATADDATWIADCPPGISPSLTPILSVADLVLIPVKASFNDLITLPDTVRFITSNTGAKVAFLGCDIDSRTNDEQTLRETLEGYGIPLLGIFTHRASYRRAGLLGKLASEIDSVAAAESNEIIKNLRKFMK